MRLAEDDEKLAVAAPAEEEDMEEEEAESPRSPSPPGEFGKDPEEQLPLTSRLDDSNDDDDDDDDYVVLSGPFDHPIGPVQEELFVQQLSRLPSAPPLALFANMPSAPMMLDQDHDQHRYENPYTQLLSTASNSENDDDASCPQNHELYQLVSEYYGSDVKFEAGKARQASLQDKIQLLSSQAWEKQTNILLLSSPSPSSSSYAPPPPPPPQSSKSSSRPPKGKRGAAAAASMDALPPPPPVAAARTVTTAVYTGQTLSLPKKLYNNFVPHTQQFTVPGTFRVASMSPGVCKLRETKKKELLQSVDQTVDFAITASAKSSAVCAYVRRALHEHDNEDDEEHAWKAICDVLLDHEMRQPCALVEAQLNLVVSAVLSSPARSSHQQRRSPQPEQVDNDDDEEEDAARRTLRYQIWLIRRVKRFSWKRELNASLTQVVESPSWAPEEWRQNDWLDRWLVLLQVCCEPMAPPLAQYVDVEVLLALLRNFPMEQGLERMERLPSATARRARVEHTLRVLSQASLRFSRTAQPFARELGHTVHGVLGRFCAVEDANVDAMVLHSSPVLAMFSLQQQAGEFLQRVSRPVCWQILATVLWGDFILEDAAAAAATGAANLEDDDDDGAHVYRYSVVMDVEGSNTLHLCPHNLREWNLVAPQVRGKFVRRTGDYVATALGYLCTLALQQQQQGAAAVDDEFVYAVARELVGAAYFDCLVPARGFANEWLLKLCRGSPWLVDRCLLPLVFHNARQVFLPRIGDLEHLIYHPSFTWTPCSLQNIALLPSWLSVVPKWPQASPPQFTVAMALFLRCDAANILDAKVGNAFAATLALAAVAIESKLGEEPRLSQLLAYPSYNAVVDQLWRVLLQVQQHPQKEEEDGEDAVSGQLERALKHFPNHAMLAFVLGMQQRRRRRHSGAADDIGSNTVVESLQVLVRPPKQQASPQHMYHAARKLAVRLERFHPVLMDLMRWGGDASAFVDQVVLARRRWQEEEEDVEFWLAQCSPGVAEDVEFAHQLLRHLPEPFAAACNWQVFARFAPAVGSLPRRLRCQVLMAQTVLQMPAWFMMGQHLQETCDVVQSAVDVLGMEHKHLVEVLSLYTPAAVTVSVPQVDDFAIYGWTDLLLSSDFSDDAVMGGGGGDALLEEDFVVSLSICAQFLFSLQVCTAAAVSSDSSALALGQLFFQYKNVQLQHQIAQRLRALSKQLHLRAVVLAPESRAPILRLANMLLDMANHGNSSSSSNSSNVMEWTLFSGDRGEGGIDFGRLCVTQFTCTPQTLAVQLNAPPTAVVPPPHHHQLTMEEQAAAPSALSVATSSQPPAAAALTQLALAVDPSHPPPPKPRRRQLNAMELLKQSVVALVDTRTRLRELSELETRQLSQLYVNVPCQVPVRDLHLGQTAGSQTVDVAHPDAEMERSWRYTASYLDGEMAAVVARFSPDRSTELFDCVQELRSFILTLGDGDDRESALTTTTTTTRKPSATEVFKRLFAIDFCRDLVQCPALCKVWLDLCERALQRSSPTVALPMLIQLVQRPWRIASFHAILPELPAKDLLSAYEAVLFPGQAGTMVTSTMAPLESQHALSLLDRLRRTCIPADDYGIVRGLLDLCFRYFAMDHHSSSNSNNNNNNEGGGGDGGGGGAAKVVDYTRRYVFKPLLPLFLRFDDGMGLVHVCQALMNPLGAYPLPGVFWEDVSSVDDALWDAVVSPQACALALQVLRPKATLKDRKMCWNQGFIGLAPLLCRHGSAADIHILLECWEVWLVAEEDDSLINAFVSTLARISSSPLVLLAALVWYARAHKLIPHLERRFRRLDWGELVVQSRDADALLHALQEVYFAERVLVQKQQQQSVPCSAMLQSILAQASFAHDFDVGECAEDFLQEAFAFTLRAAEDCASVNLMLCLPFERLSVDVICVHPLLGSNDAEETVDQHVVSPARVKLLTTVVLRDVDRLSDALLRSLLCGDHDADIESATPVGMSSEALHGLLNAYVFHKPYIVPHLVELLVRRGDVLDQFAATRASSGEAAAVEGGDVSSLSSSTLASRLLPRFLTSRELIIPATAAAPAAAGGWPCDFNHHNHHSNMSAGEWIRVFVRSDVVAAEQACHCALRLGCSRVCNELAHQVNLDTLPDLRSGLEERECVAQGSALVLVSGFLLPPPTAASEAAAGPQEVMSRTFQFVQALNYSKAGPTSLVLVCAFARVLGGGGGGDAFSLDLASEVARTMQHQSKLVADGVLCVAFAVFADLLNAFVWQQQQQQCGDVDRRPPPPSLYKQSGWTCRKLDWLQRDEFGAVDVHSLPWLLDQVRFSLFPASLHSATQLPPVMLTTRGDTTAGLLEDDSAEASNSDFVVL